MEASQKASQLELEQQKLVLQVRMQNCSMAAASERDQAREIDKASAAEESFIVRTNMLKACCRRLDYAAALERSAAGCARQIAAIERELAGDLPIPAPGDRAAFVLSAEQMAAMDDCMSFDVVAQ